MVISLEACVRREIQAMPMDATDDEAMCHEGDDGQSESLSRGSTAGDEDDDDEDDGGIVAAGTESDEEEDEEEDDDEDEKRIAELVKHVDAGKAGDTAWFQGSIAPLWNNFPGLRCLGTVTHFGTQKEEKTTTLSFITGKPSTHLVKVYRRNGSCTYIHFAGEKEAEVLRCFFTLASFMRPTWRGYKAHSSRRLAEWFDYALNYVRDVEYVKP